MMFRERSIGTNNELSFGYWNKNFELLSNYQWNNLINIIKFGERNIERNFIKFSFNRYD